MKHYDATQTAAALPFEALIDALQALFVEGCEVPLRHTHKLPVGGLADVATTLIMPAWQADKYLGIKTVNIYPSNAAKGLPGLFSTYLLFDAATGEPLAQIDGNEITSRRTAAASALAARYLANADARTLLVVGTGRVAALLPHAYRAALPSIDKILVWGRRPDVAEELVRRWAEEGVVATVVTDLASAARTADIVSTATLSTGSLIEGAWLGSNTHLDLIGGFTPSMRETDDACFIDADLYVDTDEALMKSGDLLGPMSRNVFTAADVCGTLSTLCRGNARRTTANGNAGRRTVFKSVGTALEDLAAAMLVHRAYCSLPQVK